MSEWLEWRKQGLGASDVAKMWSGLYGGSYSVAASKLGKLPEETSTVFDRGNRLEDQVLEAAALLGGFEIKEKQFLLEGVPSWKRATLDGVAVRSGVSFPVEVKTRQEGLDDTAVKAYWDAQICWQMGLMEADFAVLAVAKVGWADEITSLKVVERKFDSNFFVRLSEMASVLWDKIRDGLLPEPGASSLPYVKKVAASVSAVDGVGVLTADQIRIVKRWEQLKDCEDERKVLEAKIRGFMGECVKAEGGGFSVSHRPVRRLTKAAEEEFLGRHPGCVKQVEKFDLEAAREVDSGLLSDLKRVSHFVLTVKGDR